MDTVFIQGLKIDACHGVNDEEKIFPQPFVIDMKIGYDMTDAVRSDAIELAVSYSSVCKILTDVVKNNKFNLLEKLATECAYTVMDKLPAVQTITITVKKPKAPVKGAVFEAVGVTRQFERVTAYLALGSSLGDRKAYLDLGVRKLTETRGIAVKRRSTYIESDPYGGVAKGKFLNAAVEITTYLTPHTLLTEINRIEAECGRMRTIKWGDRTLDIDIIFYGDEVVRDKDLTIPHPEYMKRDFVLAPLKAIAGDYFCPLLNKRVRDITIQK
ncbi:MAG: 2-amino-4-hydroxy-6-hydroxymethyldihydropteridine diphosphokinase [Clostridia bacterium]|nr:2-amino-4-hydroxy-6-hydroxymethyldihydropteridine diphosphokinase [Clostridia bacterium]